MPLTLTVLPELFAICRLNQNEPVPVWASLGGFFSITRTHEELSIVCPAINLPEHFKSSARYETGWKCLRVEGPLDFTQTGILASIAVPLADASISIFAISTFDTDYLMIKEEKLTAAKQILAEAGHSIR